MMMHGDLDECIMFDRMCLHRLVIHAHRGSTGRGTRVRIGKQIEYGGVNGGHIQSIPCPHWTTAIDKTNVVMRNLLCPVPLSTQRHTGQSERS